MAKIGFGEGKSVHEKGHEETVEHRHVPGRAYEVTSPADKLIHIIGGGFFNEPRYYDTQRSYAEFKAELLANGGKITSRILDKMGLTEQAREVVETMQAVADSDTPEDLLVIAAWARDKKKGLKLRTTPQIALTLAAANKKTQPYVRRYSTSIMDRVDEVRQVFAAFRHLFQQNNSLHKGSFPHCLRKGISEVLAETSLYELLKYNSDERPTLADVLLMVSGSKKLPRRRNKEGQVQTDGWPLSKPVFEYLVNGKLTEDAPEMLKLRERFFKEVKKIEEVTPEILEKAGLTWENVLSRLGSTKEVWEFCIPIMGEMALTRNLRNFEQAGISKASWDKIYQKCGNIKDTVQLPFRFFAAERVTTGTDAKTLVSMQLDNSVQNVPELPGVTVILSDNSGSAVSAVISGKSDLRVSDTGNMLAAIIAKRQGRNAIVGVFGDSLIWVPFAQNDSTLTIKKKIDSVAQVEERSANNALAIPQYKRGTGVGGGTETGLWWAIHDLTQRKVKVDRWILCSDLCCYTQGDVNCSVNMNSYFGKDGNKATIQSMLDRYRREVYADCYVYSVNLSGYGQSQVRPHGRRTHILSGWSEQIFGVMRDLEGVAGQDTTKEQVEIPTIEVLRSKYKKN
jgi:hypothetical protein